MTINNERMKLIDKVIKLLALSEGTNHGPEAESAKKMAAKLMADHNIALGDITNTKKEPFSEKVQPLTRKAPIQYDAMLICILSCFCGVEVISRVGTITNGQYTFVGRPSDLEAAQYMVDIVFQQRDAKWKAYLPTYKEKWGGKPQGQGQDSLDEWILPGCQCQA